jgi:hypothetical protein
MGNRALGGRPAGLKAFVGLVGTAGTTPSRARRLGAWIIIVPALSLFSFSMVAGAAGLGSKSGVSSAARKIVAEKSRSGMRSGGFVVVDSSRSGIGGLLRRGAREVCWISRSQLARVSAVYRTTMSSVVVGNRTYSLVTVYGANTHALRLLLGTTAVECRLVHTRHLFFLPFDPNLS